MTGEASERRVRALSALHLLSATSSPELLNLALDLVVDVLEVDAGGVYLLDERDNVLRLRAYRSVSSEVAQDIDYLRLGEGFSGRVVASGQALIVDDVRTDPRLTRQMLNREDLRALLSVPLRARAGVSGTLWVASRAPARRFQEAERDWLEVVGGQVGLALENARLCGEVERRAVEHARLLAHVIAAQELERKRVARELHDDISQTLTALTLTTDRVLDALPAESKPLRQDVGRLKAGLARMMDSVHQVIWELRPGVLDDLGLIPALRWYANAKLAPLGIHLDFHFTELNLGLSAEEETGLFRVFQEAINNVAQHAEARSVHVVVASGGAEVVVTVTDDGKGFDLREPLDVRAGPGVSRASPRGLGLLGMRERLALLGGELEIETQPGQGASLTIKLPRAGLR